MIPRLTQRVSETNSVHCLQKSVCTILKEYPRSMEQLRRVSMDGTDPTGLKDIERTICSVADEYGTGTVPETDLPESGVVFLIAERDGKGKGEQPTR